ncbi:MAG: hypothetical protein KKB45_13805, partial [Gammaproteobacteria bacterium]|nr:hypothetical protein [Gammaproteobacteria bacterium]
SASSSDTLLPIKPAAPVTKYFIVHSCICTTALGWSLFSYLRRSSSSLYNSDAQQVPLLQAA